MTVRDGVSSAPEGAAQSGHLSRELGYRPDIDGLRALAVMLVVFSHAGVRRLAGGFVGVDVFFVISGFLITGIIARQREQGTFGFAAFYARRAKRLLPALYVMILATLAVGYWLSTPSDYSLLAESAVSAVALVSNVFFLRSTGGYFSPDASALPLLHVWSLSLEEQFYLVWPAVLLLLLRLRSPALRLALVALVGAVSFALSQPGVLLSAKAAYFLPIGRIGEFMAGALVSMAWRPRRANVLAANVTSGLGLVLILASAVLLNERSPFPGALALAPALGAALIIAAPQFGRSAMTALLSSRPFVYVGLISYSVYLWHWPLVSFLRAAGVPFTRTVVVGIVAGALLLGWASWLLLERGFRGWLDRGFRPALGLALAGGLAVLALPGCIYLQNGLPQRFPFALLTQDQLIAERNRYWEENPMLGTTLVRGQGRQLLIVGDSHAHDLAYAMQQNGFPGRIKLIDTYHQCFNFGGEPILPSDAAFCAARLQAVLAGPDLKAADVVFLHDHWGGYDEAGLAGVIAKIRQVTAAPIYVFGPKMTFSDDISPIARRAMSRRLANPAAINRFAAGYQDPQKPQLDRRLKGFFAAHLDVGARYVSMLDLQCGAKLACEVLSPDGRYLYFDAGHFSLDGARRFGARLKAAHPELF